MDAFDDYVLAQNRGFARQLNDAERTIDEQRGRIAQLQTRINELEDLVTTRERDIGQWVRYSSGARASFYARDELYRRENGMDLRAKYGDAAMDALIKEYKQQELQEMRSEGFDYFLER